MIFRGLATYDFRQPSGWLVILFDDNGDNRLETTTQRLQQLKIEVVTIDQRSVINGFVPTVTLTDGRSIQVRKVIDGTKIIGVLESYGDPGTIRIAIERMDLMTWQGWPLHRGEHSTISQVEVLDKGWIELLRVMGNDLTIVEAARVSFLGESKGPAADRKLLRYLWRHEHLTPFEQVEFQFRVRAPVVTWWQWVRHRTWNFNAQSGRYTPFEEDDFYIPTEWRGQSKSNKQGSDGLVDNQQYWSDAFKEMTTDGFSWYQSALDNGVAKEQARLFLPGWASYYTWVCKVDARNLLHFLRLRMAPEAQYEIRVYAEAIYQHFLKPVLPWTAEVFEESLR